MQGMLIRWPTWLLGVVFATLATILVIIALLLGVQNNFSVLYLTFILSEPVGALVGGLIIARQPRNPVGWLISVHAFSFILGEFSRQYAIYGIQTMPGSLPAPHLVGWLVYWIWAPGIACGFALLPLYFPNGRLLTTRWRYALWWMTGAMSLMTFLMAFVISDMETPGIPNPFGFIPLFDLMPFLNGVLWISCCVLGIASMALRFWRADADERKQIQWVFYSMALIIFGDRIIPVDGLFSELLLSLSIAVLWGSIGVAVLSYRMYDIDPRINRTLLYGSLTVLLAGMYITVVVYVGVLLDAFGYDVEQRNLMLQIVALVLIVLCFQPLRLWLQRTINRLLYGHRDEPYVVLSSLGQRLGLALSPDDVLPTVVATVRETLKLPYAEIRLHTDEQLGPAATSGTPVEERLSIPLIYQHEHIGELVLGQRGRGEPFSSRERRLLDDLAHHISIAAHAVRLNYDLQVSRERIVSAREEERRRLQRDLHDGLGPTLAGLTMQLDAARALMRDDPDTSEALLTEVKDELQATIGSVRRLVYQLRPLALGQLGLVSTLREHALNTCQASGLQVELHASEPLPPLSAAVEVAAYYIIVEALNNVVRHAKATRCEIRITVADALDLLVIDNGVGLGERYRSGIGLHSMRERAAELGGTCEVVSSPTGGTTMHAVLPLENVHD
jgi:signal transduction histidine kinase